MRSGVAVEGCCGGRVLRWKGVAVEGCCGGSGVAVLPGVAAAVLPENDRRNDRPRAY